MKTSLRKLRGFALNKQGPKERRDLRPFSQLDELAQAAQDMQDMRDCYDRLLSAAAATTNSAFEFSESLRELGDCLLEKTALNDDEESGKVLLMLGKVQYEVQKLIDSYRSHISHTITVPSESLLNELRIVEEMKRQCDEKREVYEDMKAKHREKGRSRSGRENFSTQQLIMAHDEYDQEATLFVFRLKSLKQGQSRSLLTQAARHHAAQLCFFKKALKSLEAVEPYVKLVTEQQHIDYHFVGLEDDDLDDYDDYNDDRDDDDDDGSYDSNDDGELSFDYGQNDQEQDVSTSRNSMEVDQVDLTFPKVAKVEDLKNNVNRLRRHNASFRARIVSQSAPLFAENKVDPSEKLRQMRPSFTRKFHSYVLPTPIDAKSAVSIGSGNPVKHTAITNLSGGKQNLWHSTPLEPKMYEKNSQVESIYVPKVIKVQSVLKESNNNIATRQLPPPLLDGHIFSRNDQVSASDSKKIKRQAFSGPLTSKPWSLNHPQLYSGPLLRNPVLQPSSSPPKASAGASPTFMSSPKISELHELPRPPTSSSQSPRSTGLVGHSAPLVSRAQVQSSIKMVTKSPLPKPPQTVSRSLSIPSNNSRVVDLQVSKPMEVPLNSLIAEDLVSPPLSPLALSNN